MTFYIFYKQLGGVDGVCPPHRESVNVDKVRVNIYSVDVTGNKSW